MEREEKIEDLKWQLVEMEMFQILSSNPKYHALLAELNALQIDNGKLQFLVDGYGREPQKKMPLSIKEQKKIRKYAELQMEIHNCTNEAYYEAGKQICLKFLNSIEVKD